MAGSLNRATLIGNVGADPEMRSLNNGARVANLRIATSESWKDKHSGEKKERTEWHRVVVFNEGLVGVIEKYVQKGSKILVEGQIQTRKWEKDGVDMYSTEIVIQAFGGQLILLGGKSDGGGSSDGGYSRRETSQPRGGSTQREDFAADLDDEIPF